MKAKHRHVDRSCYSPPLLFRLKFKREFADQSLLSENELCGRLKNAQILRDGDVPKVLEETFGALKFGWFNVSNDSNRAAPGSIRLTGGQVLKMSRAGREQLSGFGKIEPDFHLRVCQQGLQVESLLLKLWPGKQRSPNAAVLALISTPDEPPERHSFESAASQCN
jgi:hypothetical protein